jgi:hypothetical protein
VTGSIDTNKTRLWQILTQGKSRRDRHYGIPASMNDEAGLNHSWQQSAKIGFPQQG